jgi:hypothetical protein
VTTDIRPGDFANPATNDSLVLNNTGSVIQNNTTPKPASPPKPPKPQNNNTTPQPPPPITPEVPEGPPKTDFEWAIDQ